MELKTYNVVLLVVLARNVRHVEANDFVRTLLEADQCHPVLDQLAPHFANPFDAFGLLGKF